MSDEAFSCEKEDLKNFVEVSVIIPVFNAMPYLTTLLDSLAAQDLSQDSYEVIAVNDGSTDESPAALDAYALSNPNFRVIHQENSGWPGKPRNVGLDSARGRYVFFADADDQLGVEALRRMVEFADKHGSDVVVPRMVGRDGRWVRASTYTETVADADLEEVFKTLSPQKLFRRSLFLNFGIRFSEEKIRLEDGMVLARAYLKARRVSVLADYDYYYIRARDDGQNISSSRLDPIGYTWSIGEVSRLIKENDQDPERASRIILDLYRRKCLKIYAPDRFPKMSDTVRDRWIQEHKRFIDKYISPELESELPFPFRQRSQLVRAGNKTGLLKLARIERNSPVSAMLVKGRWSSRSVLLELEITGGQPEKGRAGLFLQVQDRGSESWTEFQVAYKKRLQRDPDKATVWLCSVSIPIEALRRETDTVLDLYLRSTSENTKKRARVSVMEKNALPEPRSSIRPYVTDKGNFSLDIVRIVNGLLENHQGPTTTAH